MFKSKKIFIIGFLITSVLVGFYVYTNHEKKETNHELGTCTSPEEAFIETHKALQLVSKNINSGMKNAAYLEEYDTTKKMIFKE